MTSWTVQLDPPAVSTGRTMLDLDAGPLRTDQAGIDWGLAEITAYMAAEQQWGAVPISYRVPNRTVTIPLFLGGDDIGDPELAKTLLEQKVALLQREKGTLLRQRQGGDPMYADIVNATLHIPDQWLETGHVEPGVSLVLECLPDFYGDEITLDSITATGGVEAVLRQSGVQAVIKGDHPGRAQIMVTDSAGSDEYGLLWAFRSRHYDAAAPINLGVSGSGSATSTWTQIASYVGSHVGAYRVWARVSGALGASVRAAWQIGDAIHGFIGNPQVVLPVASTELLVSLGQIQLDRVPLGTQRFALSIQCLNGAMAVDQVYLQPIDESAGYLQGVPANSDPAVRSTGTVAIRYDGAWRSASSGAYSPVLPIGDLARIPPSGAEGRAVELFLRPSRGDLTLATVDSATTDGLSAVVSYRPSYLFRP